MGNIQLPGSSSLSSQPLSRSPIEPQAGPPSVPSSDASVYLNEADGICVAPPLATGQARTSLALDPAEQICPSLGPELNQALNKLTASDAFKKLSPKIQSTVLAFFAQSRNPGQLQNARLLLDGVLADSFKLFPEKTLSEILVANDSPVGLQQRLNIKLEDALMASSAELSTLPALTRYLHGSGQATVLNAAEALIASGDPAALTRAGKLLGDKKNLQPTGQSPKHQLERLNLQLAMQKSANKLQEVLDMPHRDKYELVLLSNQWSDLSQRLETMEQHYPLISAQESLQSRQLKADLETLNLQTQLYLAKDIKGQPERLRELEKLQSAYGQSIEANRGFTQRALDTANAAAEQLTQKLQANPKLAAVTGDYARLETQAAALQREIQAGYENYQTADPAQRPALDKKLASQKQELLTLLGQKEKLASDIDHKLNQQPEIKADYHHLFGLRREISQAQGKLANLERLSGEARSIDDSATLARALDSRRQDSLKISFSEGMSYSAVRTALGAMLTRKADHSSLTAEMRLGASVFMLGDIYFLGGMKIEAESDDNGQVVLSFAGYGGVGGRVQTPSASVRAQGAVGVKTEYVFNNLDDASRFILESMNKYDPSFIDFVQDVKGPVQGRLPSPNVYTRDNYKIVPVLIDGAARLGNQEIKATINYEKLTYQNSGKFYESKVDIIAEGGGIGATLTLEWEKHPNGIELKTTPHYGSALEIKIDLASFSGKAISTTGITDALLKALTAAQDKFSLTPELISNLRGMVQKSTDQAMAQAQQQLSNVQAPAKVKTHTDVKTFTVDGEMSSKLLIRFPFTRDLQGQLQVYPPQIGLDNRANLSVDGRIPIGGAFSVLAGFEVRAEMRKMLTTDKVNSGR